MLRNSRILGVFDAILHAEEFGPRVIEIVGRGIAADARCTAETMSAKGERFDDTLGPAARARALAYSDRLIELGDIEDGLVELLRRRSVHELGETDFQRVLAELVVRLEARPQGSPVGGERPGSERRRAACQGRANVRRP